MQINTTPQKIIKRTLQNWVILRWYAEILRQKVRLQRP